MTDNLPAHSKLGASSLSRWSKCPGSVKLCADIPSTTSSFAEEGTRAHELAANMLLNAPWSCDDKEMIEHCTTYMNLILAEKADEMLVEHKFHLKQIDEEMFGTADCTLYFKDQKLLKTFDLKYGAGVMVEAENNLQLQFYALGALLSTNHPVNHVEICIIQPRCGDDDTPVRRWRFEAIKLLDFVADLKAWAKATREENAPLVPGKSQCKFCPAKGICPALYDKAREVAKAEFLPQVKYDKKKLAETLDWLDAVESWAKGVREFAYLEAQRGRIPPGYKLVEKRKNREWAKSDEETVKFLKNIFNIPHLQVYATKLKSVAQIEKLLDKKQMELLTKKKMVAKQSSGTALVPEIDPREALKVGAELDFGGVQIV